MFFFDTANTFVRNVKNFTSVFSNMDKRRISDDRTLGQITRRKGSTSSLGDCGFVGFDVILAVPPFIQPFDRTNGLLANKVTDKTDWLVSLGIFCLELFLDKSFDFRPRITRQVGQGLVVNGKILRCEFPQRGLHFWRQFILVLIDKWQVVLEHEIIRFIQLFIQSNLSAWDFDNPLISILCKKFRSSRNIFGSFRQRVVIGCKGSSTRILGAVQAYRTIFRAMGRNNIVHVHDRVDSATNTWNETSLGHFEISLDIGFQINNAAFPNVSIPKNTIRISFHVVTPLAKQERDNDFRKVDNVILLQIHARINSHVGVVTQGTGSHVDATLWLRGAARAILQRGLAFLRRSGRQRKSCR
mmetsp:Transcript_5288/g.10181  ORF Transcript_5288/g.10181 Transcript_5288/m.10181 type:complete len:357 (+) Transcript_5288:810-1880(+)